MQGSRLDEALGPSDPVVYDHAVDRLREAAIVLPTFRELADPLTIPPGIAKAVSTVTPDDADPRNLFRVHWHNDRSRAKVIDVPDHVVLPSELTGVDAMIVVVLGDRFPMIRAHKVLAAYGCLAPRLVTGRFDPRRHRAVWPSTGNYCRGGVAISRIMGCRAVAVLPQGMSRERFEWLDRWVSQPDDIIRTPGTESNVKEIYDRCAELSVDPDNVILNQFSEFGNYLVHYLCTGTALDRVFEVLRTNEPDRRLAAFVAASGSSGTLAAGDLLKERHGARIAAVEALECPTMLANGFGEHNIQGIGDKHIPLIHNVMNTDVVIGVSDRATDHLNVLFNTTVGRRYLLERRGIQDGCIESLNAFGLSSICNVVAAIKMAKHFRLGSDDVILTVATDGAEMYRSEVDRVMERYLPEGFDETCAAEVFGEHLAGAATDHVLELTLHERDRIFDLGYYTWVEQQGVSADSFVARRDQMNWASLRDRLGEWDGLIEEMNDRTGVARMP